MRDWLRTRSRETNMGFPGRRAEIFGEDYMKQVRRLYSTSSLDAGGAGRRAVRRQQSTMTRVALLRMRQKSRQRATGKESHARQKVYCRSTVGLYRTVLIGKDHRYSWFRPRANGSRELNYQLKNWMLNYGTVIWFDGDRQWKTGMPAYPESERQVEPET